VRYEFHSSGTFAFREGEGLSDKFYIVYRGTISLIKQVGENKNKPDDEPPQSEVMDSIIDSPITIKSPDEFSMLLDSPLLKTPKRASVAFNMRLSVIRPIPEENSRKNSGDDSRKNSIVWAGEGSMNSVDSPLFPKSRRSTILKQPKRSVFKQT